MPAKKSMTPKQFAAALGELDGDDVLPQLDLDGGPALATALRDSFQKGNEQGNARRVMALVQLQGEDALDVIEAVLRDEVEVGGIYSNLRNTVLEIMAERFLGDPRLRAPLLRALEIDEYLDIDTLARVLMPYDAERARALMRQAVEQGIPAAMTALAQIEGGRAELLEILDAKLEGGKGQSFIEALDELAREEDFAARILPYATTVPAAALVALDFDQSRATEFADRFDDPSPAWRSVALQAWALLPPDEVYERGSPLFTDPKRSKGTARDKLESLCWQGPALEDGRWIGWLSERLEHEDNDKLRGLIIKALGKCGPDAVAVILAAPRDDKDRGVLAELPAALSAIGGDEAIAQVRDALATAKGRRKTILKNALAWLEE